MKLRLSRGRENRYMLTRFEPIRTGVAGTDFEDLYFRPGDPMAVGNLCSASVKLLFGVELAPFCTAVVDLEGMVLGDGRAIEFQSISGAIKDAV